MQGSGYANGPGDADRTFPVAYREQCRSSRYVPVCALEGSELIGRFSRDVTQLQTMFSCSRPKVNRGRFATAARLEQERIDREWVVKRLSWLE
jgi:hypothetical protein